MKLLLLQTALIIAVVASLSWPPSEGRMLLIPLFPGASRHLVPEVVAHDGRLVQAGALPGSMIVYGEGARLTWPMLRFGIVPLAAAAGGRADPVEAS